MASSALCGKDKRNWKKIENRAQGIKGRNKGSEAKGQKVVNNC
jgi:hypothetical protein